MPGAGDPEEGDPKYQEELREFCESLDAAGVTFSQRAIAFDAVDVLGHPLGEFVIAFARATGPTLGVVLVTWLKGRARRKVRMNFGGVKAEAGTPEEIGRLLHHITEFRASKRKGEANQ
jgi:hypothetical protein